LRVCVCRLETGGTGDHTISGKTRVISWDEMDGHHHCLSQARSGKDRKEGLRILCMYPPPHMTWKREEGQRTLCILGGSFQGREQREQQQRPIRNRRRKRGSCVQILQVGVELCGCARHARCTMRTCTSSATPAARTSSCDQRPSVCMRVCQNYYEVARFPVGRKAECP
jgi:hypothetical protein